MLLMIIRVNMTKPQARINIMRTQEVADSWTKLPDCFELILK